MCGNTNICTGKFIDSDTILTEVTKKSLIESAKIMMYIIDKNIKNAYTLIRPPGHHSCSDNHEGFCIFNNAILLSKYIWKITPDEGIFIMDWDVHHGNGTQKFIETCKEKHIYYASMHYYDGISYPKTGSDIENTENILNIPFGKNIKDDEYLNLFNIVIKFFENVSMKIGTIIVSNGLDAHIDDPIKLASLTNISYVKMSQYFKQCKKRLIFLLEGGYNIDVITNVSTQIIELFPTE